MNYRNTAIVCLLLLFVPEVPAQRPPATPYVTASDIREAQQKVRQAMTAWQDGQPLRARQLLIEAITYGVPEHEFGVGPRMLLDKIDDSLRPVAPRTPATRESRASSGSSGSRTASPTTAPSGSDAVKGAAPPTPLPGAEPSRAAIAATPYATANAKRQAQQKVQQAMAAWQDGHPLQARQLLVEAITYGVPEHEFGLGPRMLLDKIDESLRPAAPNTHESPTSPASRNGLATMSSSGSTKSTAADTASESPTTLHLPPAASSPSAELPAAPPEASRVAPLPAVEATDAAEAADDANADTHVDARTGVRAGPVAEPGDASEAAPQATVGEIIPLPPVNPLDAPAVAAGAPPASTTALPEKEEKEEEEEEEEEENEKEIEAVSPPDVEPLDVPAVAPGVVPKSTESALSESPHADIPWATPPPAVEVLDVPAVDVPPATTSSEPTTTPAPPPATTFAPKGADTTKPFDNALNPRSVTTSAPAPTTATPAPTSLPPVPSELATPPPPATADGDVARRAAQAPPALEARRQLNPPYPPSPTQQPGEQPFGAPQPTTSSVPASQQPWQPASRQPSPAATAPSLRPTAPFQPVQPDYVPTSPAPAPASTRGANDSAEAQAGASPGANQPVAHHHPTSAAAMPTMFQYWGDASQATTFPVTRSQVFGRPGAVAPPVYVRPVGDPHQITSRISPVAAPLQPLAPAPDEASDEVIETLELPSEMFQEAMPAPPGYVVAGDQPMFGAVLRDLTGSCCNECSRVGKFFGLFRREPCSDGGIGREYLASAPMFMDVATPLPNTLRIRFDAAYNVQSPDRAEYYYSSLVGTGDRIDYQDVRFQMELGGPRLSVATEVPIRVLDPVLGENTAGLGDMNIAVKTVLVDGKTWQITQLFRTIMNTGAVTHGLSSGHVRMEPGLLFRMAWDDDTFWHGQIKYRFPIGGNPIHSGQVLEVGSAISKIGYETDQAAILPTVEVNSFFVLDGQQFPFGGNTGVPVDGEMITNIAPSLRMILENGSDLGVLEFGLGGSFAISSIRWHSFMLALETRITY